MTLITNKSDTNLFKNMITTFDIVGGADISRLGRGKGPRAKPPVKALLKDFDLNTISITLGFKSHGFERGHFVLPRLLMFLRLKTQTR
jgi:hypothetical protein